MSNPPSRSLILCTLVSIAVSWPQPCESQAPSHQHYARSADANQPSPTGALAPRLQNLGTHTFPVTAASPQSQRFINQGLNLSYAFNHAESARSFREAARLDPSCAMAYGDRRSSSAPTSMRRWTRPMNPWRST